MSTDTMKYLIVAFLLFTTTETSWAFWTRASPPKDGIVQVIPPPERFIKPYKGKLTLHHASRSKLALRCLGSIACAWTYKPPTKCVVWMPVVGTKFKKRGLLTKEAYYLLLIHEMAHCNGWSPRHPLT